MFCDGKMYDFKVRFRIFSSRQTRQSNCTFTLSKYIFYHKVDGKKKHIVTRLRKSKALSSLSVSDKIVIARCPMQY